MNGAMIRRLRNAAGSFVSIAELGAEPHAIRQDLEAIESFGFLLERHPYHGVAWRGAAPRLCPDQIEWELGTSRVGRRIAVWNRVSSTNDLAAAAAGSKANDGFVVLAEEQTEGRGRRGRAWIAPPGSSLLLSTLIFPTGPLADPSWLTALGAVAVADVVSEVTQQEVHIKWPNDVRVDGRKIAGILIERGVGAILGIGVNVNFVAEDLPPMLRDLATSLQMITGSAWDRSELARDLIKRLDDLYLEGIESGPSCLAERWARRLEPMGRDIILKTRQGEVAGRLVEADLIRGLRILLNPGATRWVSHAEILGIDGEIVAHLS